MQTTPFPESAFAGRLDGDRFGVLASVLCAIHCAVTPFLFLILPSFGRVWAHPASHWGIALFVGPVAATASVSGKSVLYIPPAAIVTTLGGIALIITHIGNLCACRSCRRDP